MTLRQTKSSPNYSVVSRDADNSAGGGVRAGWLAGRRRGLLTPAWRSTGWSPSPAVPIIVRSSPTASRATSTWSSYGATLTVRATARRRWTRGRRVTWTVRASRALVPLATPSSRSSRTATSWRPRKTCATDRRRQSLDASRCSTVRCCHHQTCWRVLTRYQHTPSGTSGIANISGNSCSVSQQQKDKHTVYS